MKDEEEKVGYGKPPRHSQFQKGRSGNPSGTRKRRPSIAEEVEAELLEPIFINENGRRSRISKARALVKAQVQKGLKGDVQAARWLVGQLEQLRPDNDVSPTVFTLNMGRQLDPPK